MLRKILLVDDDENLLDSLLAALRKEPFVFRAAKSAKEALKILANEKIAVVVSDEKMPGMSGTSFLAQVYRNYPNTLRIMLTGYGSVKSALKAIHDGWVYRYILKPCQPADLMAAIHQGLLLQTLTNDQWRLLMSPEEQDELLGQLEAKAAAQPGSNAEPSWIAVAESKSISQSKIKNFLQAIRAPLRKPAKEREDKHTARRRPGAGEQRRDVLEEAKHLESKVRDLFEQQRFEEATAAAQSCMSFLMYKLGRSHPLTLKAAKALAALHAELGEYGLALPLFQRCLKIELKELGPDDAKTAATLFSIAGVYRAKGDNEEAEKHYLRVLEIQKRVLGPMHVQVAKTCSALANFYTSIGKLSQGSAMYQESLKIFEEIANGHDRRSPPVEDQQPGAEA